MITATYAARTSSEIVHSVYDYENMGRTKSYTLCNGQVASRVRKTDDAITCKRCAKAK